MNHFYVLQSDVSSFLYFFIITYENNVKLMLRWPDASDWNRVLHHIVAGEKVFAIKTLRDATRIPHKYVAPPDNTELRNAWRRHDICAESVLGLRNAKELVEWLIANPNAYYHDENS